MELTEYITQTCLTQTHYWNRVREKGFRYVIILLNQSGINKHYKNTLRRCQHLLATVIQKIEEAESVPSSQKENGG